MVNTRSALGFTLIEVMIVVAIIAILAAVALPAYDSQARKAKRADAKVALTRAAQLQERRYTEVGSYSNSMADLGGTASPDGKYSMAVTIPATAGCTSGTRFYCYTLTATPTFPDAECTTLTLTHTGVQGATGSNTAVCWQS